MRQPCAGGCGDWVRGPGPRRCLRCLDDAAVAVEAQANALLGVIFMRMWIEACTGRPPG